MKNIKSELFTVLPYNSTFGTVDNYYSALLETIESLDDDDWESLSDDAQEWYNDAIDALDNDRQIVGFLSKNDIDAHDVEIEVDGAEVEDNGTVVHNVDEGFLKEKVLDLLERVGKLEKSITVLMSEQDDVDVASDNNVKHPNSENVITTPKVTVKNKANSGFKAKELFIDRFIKGKTFKDSKLEVMTSLKESGLDAKESSINLIIRDLEQTFCVLKDLGIVK